MSKYRDGRLPMAALLAFSLTAGAASAHRVSFGGELPSLSAVASFDSSPVADRDDNGLGVQQPDASANPDSPATADKQPNSKADIATVASVRRSLVNDNSLSMLGHNVTVTANGGVVTLRGEVKDDNEKMAVENTARHSQGVTKIVNQIQVKQQ